MKGPPRSRSEKVGGPVRITPCRACGHVAQVSTETGLCGRGTCIKKRKNEEEKKG